MDILSIFNIQVLSLPTEQVIDNSLSLSFFLNRKIKIQEIRFNWKQKWTQCLAVEQAIGP